MSPHPSPHLHARRALTLLEVLVALAVLGVLIALVAPSMQELIGMQRLRSINAQLVNDMSFARGEAVSRNQFVGATIRNQSGEPNSCYVLFGVTVDPLDPGFDKTSPPTDCNCANAVGSVCSGVFREIRTVQIPRDLSIQFLTPALQPKWFVYNPTTGGMSFPPANTFEVAGNEFCIEVRRSPRGRLRTNVSTSGRSTVCTPDSSVPGVAACAAYSSTARNCLGIP